jgi:hypothetical protein
LDFQPLHHASFARYSGSFGQAGAAGINFSLTSRDRITRITVWTPGLHAPVAGILSVPRTVPEIQPHRFRACEWSFEIRRNATISPDPPR